MLKEQTRTPDVLIVVDNESSARTESIVDEGTRGASFPTRYVDPGLNTGPAGAMRIAMELALAEGADDDWLVRVDDDRPMRHAAIETLLAAAVETREGDPMIGAIGFVGSRVDLRRARFIKPPNAVDGAVTAVDYVATNSMAMFRLGAVRAVGPFHEELFFGWTEVEYGLRLRRAGFNVYRYDGKPWERFQSRARIRMSETGPRSGWRRYYSVRNQVYVLRSYGHPVSALRAGFVRGIAKPMLNVPRRPGVGLRALGLGVRAVRDGWHGRLGLTVDPDDWLVPGAALEPT